MGIVGHSGSGKSTLIVLLLKNFKVGIGDIIIHNQSLYDTSSDSLCGSRYH
ncbi:ATP-binding cassette domain-containing protein [Rickettsia sp. 2024-CO-Wats]|uniref:ATP-binding cassette domain-containing protein n=1 Tax=unclassified Rickettsia TaxID=114295 RepID=UPI00370D3BA1